MFQSFESGQALFIVVFHFLLGSILLTHLIVTPSFLCSSVSEALFALSFSLLSECSFFFSMLKLLYGIVEMNNTGVKVGFNRPKMTLSMRVFGPRNSAHVFWHSFLYGVLIDKPTSRHIYITRNLD